MDSATGAQNDGLRREAKPMRKKAVLIIMAIFFTVTSVNFLISYLFTNNNIHEANEQQLSFALDIADNLVATQMNLLRSDANTISERLVKSDTAEEMIGVMAQQLEEFPKFISLTVFDRHGIHVEDGLTFHLGNLVPDDIFKIVELYILSAFDGESIVSAPYHNRVGNEFIANVFVPMGVDYVLSATFDGMLFSELLSRHTLWDTGNILLINAEGTIIANVDHLLVTEQRNYIELAINDTDMQGIGGFYRKMITTEYGSSYYSYENHEFFSVYKRVTDSVAGWRIAVVAPLDESPFIDLNRGLLTAAVTFLIVGLLVSVFISGYVIKPFKKIEAQSKTIKKQSELLQNAHDRTKLLLDTSPQACRLIRRISAGKYEMFECNEEAVKLFMFKDKQDAKARYFETYPELQPDGTNSLEEGARIFEKVYSEGSGVFNFTFKTMDGTLIPSEITLVRVEYDNEYVIAGYNRDLREFNRMMNEIEYRDKMLSAGNSSATTLLSAIEEEKFDDSLLECMGIVGTNFDVDRVQIWKNESINGDLYFVHQYKWLSEFGKKKLVTPVGTSFSYKERPKWEKLFRRGKYINSSFSALSKEDRDFLAVYEIKTVAIIPLFLQDHFWGLLTIDDCWRERIFTEDEIDILRSIGLMIASALLRREMTKNLHNASNAKSDFLASMSHEMRTPLNAIIGLTRLSLENSEIDEETSSNLEKVYNSGEMLLSIVNDILDISKIEAGRMALIEVEYDVPSLINDTVTQNVLRIADRPIKLKLNIKADLHSRLIGDELRVKQILNNLLSNAIKYTNEGTVELSVHCEQDEDKIWVIIEVSDTGVGIRSEDIDSLFDDYAQLDVKENRRTEGTGLGLPITKSLVGMMGGTISVSSKYGKGSMFTVRIAQKFVSDVRIGQQVVNSLKKHHYSDEKRTRDAKIKRITLPYARVLVVDDNPTNLDVAKGLMKPYGMQIDCVLSGQQAIDAIKNEKPRYNAIFMDHMMPGIDGIEATRIIREEIGTEYAKNIPIIALTANAIAGNESMFLSKGFQAFISKPVELPRLDEVIRHWIRDKSQEAMSQQYQASGDADDDLDAGQQTADDADKDTKARKSTFKGASISGLDILKGIKRFGGDEETYLDSLRSYAENNGAIIEDLNAITEDTLDGYAIAVHGLKGSSYGVCANIAGDMAAELEEAAKNGDFDFVKINNAAFIDHVQKLVNDIKNLYEEVVADIKKRKKKKPDTAILKKLFEACKRFDTEVIDEQIAELTAYEYDLDGDLVDELYKSAHQFKYKQIRDKLAIMFNEE